MSLRRTSLLLLILLAATLGWIVERGSAARHAAPSNPAAAEARLSAKADAPPFLREDDSGEEDEDAREDEGRLIPDDDAVSPGFRPASTGPGVSVPAVQAYAWPTSVDQGDSVNIYVSTTEPAIDMYIYRRGSSLVQMAYYPGLPGRDQVIPASVWANGCGWIVTKRVPIPATWPSGVYYALCQAPGVGSWYAIFTVREDQPGSTASILFQSSITTWQAYNAWGGKSLYDYNSTDHARSHIVSFQRPYD